MFWFEASDRNLHCPEDTVVLFASSRVAGKTIRSVNNFRKYPGKISTPSIAIHPYCFHQSNTLNQLQKISNKFFWEEKILRNLTMTGSAISTSKFRNGAKRVCGFTKIFLMGSIKIKKYWIDLHR
jgi:hypothetical protein